MLGLGRTGAGGSNGSGDYAIAFSTAGGVRAQPLSNDSMSPLFLAVVEATEEAVYNSLFKAQTTEANGQRVEALPPRPGARAAARPRGYSITRFGGG